MESGFPCYDVDGKPCVAREQQRESFVSAEVSVSLPRRLWRWLYPRLVNSLPWAWREYRQLQRKVSRFLQEQKIDLLILSEENVGYATPIWTQAAHAAGVPVVVVPYTVADASEPAGAVMRRRPVSSYNRWPNWIAGKYCILIGYMNTSGHKLLRLPARRPCPCYAVVGRLPRPSRGS